MTDTTGSLNQDFSEEYFEDLNKYIRDLLSLTQFNKLHEDGMTKQDIGVFVKELEKELKAQAKSRTLIPSEYVRRRAEGMKPEDIDYDLVHRFR